MRLPLAAIPLAGLLTLTPAAHAATPSSLTALPSTGARTSPAPWDPMPLEAALVQAVMPLFGFTIISLDAVLPTAVGHPPLGLHRALTRLPR